MRNVVIDQKGSRLTYERQILLIQHDSFQKPISLPFNQIQSLTITTNIDISTNLLTKLSEHQIALTILPSGASGQTSCLHGNWHKAVTRRQIQYEVLRDEECKEQWATLLVKLKIHRQINLLHRLAKQNCSSDCQDVYQTIDKLQQNRRQLKTYFFRKNSTLVAPRKNLASLRGIEGSSASLFFGVYQSFFDKDLQFTKRNRRPPKDPVNVLLSLGYTLLQGICERAAFLVGFDPFLGVLHEVSYGRQSLACDFAELQRDKIEWFVWQLFASGQITKEDFSIKPNQDKPCELLKAGRSRFYQAFTAIRPSLEKQATAHIWAWLHRLEGQCIITGEEAILNASLDYMNDF